MLVIQHMCGMRLTVVVWVQHLDDLPGFNFWSHLKSAGAAVCATCAHVYVGSIVSPGVALPLPEIILVLVGRALLSCIFQAVLVAPMPARCIRCVHLTCCTWGRFTYRKRRASSDYRGRVCKAARPRHPLRCVPSACLLQERCWGMTATPSRES